MAKIIYFLFETQSIKVFLLHLSLNTSKPKTMKNFLFPLLAVLLFCSCEDTEINEIALQAKVDNRFYKSADARAILNDDSTLTIQGTSQREGLTIKLGSLRDGNFSINGGANNYAIYEDLGGNIYTTQPNGDGVVTISELNEINKTISGTFNFNAILPGIDTIFVSQGVMYNIPYNDGTITDPNNAGSFTAKVDANPFSPITVIARKTENNIVISASTASTSIVLQLKGDVEPGSFTLPQSGFKATYRNADGEQTTTEGLIEVSAHNMADKTIKGTFRFTTNRAQITEGQFEITYR